MLPLSSCGNSLSETMVTGTWHFSNTVWLEDPNNALRIQTSCMMKGSLFFNWYSWRGMLPSEVRHRIFPAYDNVLDVTIVPIGANSISKVAKISILEVLHRTIPLYDDRAIMFELIIKCFLKWDNFEGQYPCSVTHPQILPFNHLGLNVPICFSPFNRKKHKQWDLWMLFTDDRRKQRTRQLER